MGYDIHSLEIGMIQFQQPIQRKEIKRLSPEVADIFQKAVTRDNRHYKFWYSGRLFIAAKALDILQHKLGDKIQKGHFTFAGEDMEIWRWDWNPDSQAWEESVATIKWEPRFPVDMQKYY